MNLALQHRPQITSLFAYQEAKKDLGAKQMAVFEELLKHESMTNRELKEALGWEINCVTPRIYELRQLGLVFEDKKRLCRITGRLAIAWRVV